ncbi:MAG: hypothetical protein CMB99_16190 [Flavobacteriaceae bacterium]|nr:hypothetical protein [Flavobacteriaceae bacterium]
MQARGDWQKAKPQDKQQAAQWQESAPVDLALAARYGQGLARDVRNIEPWGKGVELDRITQGVWDYSQFFADSISALPWDNSTNARGANDRRAVGSWFYSGVKLTPTISGLYAPPGSTAAEFDLTGSYAPPGAGSAVFDLSVTIQAAAEGDPIQALDNRLGMPWGSPPPNDVTLPSPWGEGIAVAGKAPPISWEVEPGDPLKPAPTITIKNAYLLMNHINLKTTADNTPLKFGGFSVSMDIDSFGYQFSATLLNQASYDKVMTAADPVDVELNINGHALNFMIEGGQESDGDNLKAWSVKGTSRSQLLGPPYAELLSDTNTGTIDAKGYIQSLLVGSGFTLEWPTGLASSAVTWNIPAGVLSYVDKSAMGVLRMLADSIGAVIVPDLSQDKIKVQPRWTMKPWALYDNNPDVLVHESMTVESSNQYEPAPAYDKIYVAGENHGVIAEVYRADTGGVSTAPDITDPLLTDSTANIQRGTQALAEYQKMRRVGLKVLVLESGGPGIIYPGQIIEQQHGDSAKDWRGLVLANTISVGSDGVDLYQNLIIARPV